MSLEFNTVNFDIIKNKILGVINKNKPIVIFGGGSHGQMTYKTFKEYKYEDRIIAFCDNDLSKSNTSIDNINVYRYSELKSQYKDVLFLICSTWCNEIVSQLKETGEENIVIWDASYNIGTFSYNILSNWKKHLTEEVKDKILKVEKLLYDDESKDVLQEILDMRGTGEFIETKNLQYNYQQYFDSRIWSLGHDEIYVDLGAFNGDTIIQFCNTVNNLYKEIIAFEPSRSNFSLLQELIKKNNIEAEIYNLGSWNERTTTTFGSSNMGFGILNHGEEVVELNALDNLFLDIPITFLKMDVEGSEKESLEGAKKIIKRYNPKLAISIYHKIEDIYEIPLWINRLVPEYKIILRRHKNPSYMNEIMCYAYI